MKLPLRLLSAIPHHRLRKSLVKSESFEAVVGITIPKTNNYLKVKQAIEGLRLSLQRYN
jgi:hypothetical protein